MFGFNLTKDNEVERELIFRTLAFTGGNKARASNLLGMSRRNLYNRLQRYELHETNGYLNGPLIETAAMVAREEEALPRVARSLIV
jgi:regulatory Fis family protein